MGGNGTGGSVRLRKLSSKCHEAESSLMPMLSAAIDSVPMARPVPPEDVARTILFLASERYSGSVHGQLIPIDGGKAGTLIWTQDELEQRQ